MSEKTAPEGKGPNTGRAEPGRHANGANGEAAQDGRSFKEGALEYFHYRGSVERAREVLRLFQAAKKAASIYPPNHEICLGAFAEFMRGFREFLTRREAFSLQVVGEEFFFEGRLLARESVLYYPLIKEFQEKGIGGLSIGAGLGAGEFVGFLYLLNRGSEELRAQGGLKALLDAKGISNIAIDDPGTWREKPPESRERSTAREEYYDAVNVIRELADQVVSDRRLSTGKANRVVGAMLSRVGENRSAVLGLATIKSYDEYTSFHSVNVLILSLALGSMLPLDRGALIILGTGALLHDLGKITIPQGVLTKSGPLTAQEWEMMRDHPARGADILLAQPGVHPLSVMVAYEHHARYDLRGYPRINGKRLQGLFSRIVQVCDVYDAMTTTRPYQRARTPDQAMRVLVKEMGSSFDPLLVKVFMDMMGMFPVGTLVRLVTGETAVVYEAAGEDAAWPRVKVIRDAEGGEVEPRVMDLARLVEKVGEGGRAILESIHPEDAGIDPQDYL